MAAIYQWFVGDEVVFTTTLYPIDVTEQLQLMATSNPGGYLYNFPVDYSTLAPTMQNIEIDQILLEADVGADYTTITPTMIAITIDDLLQIGDGGEDYSTLTPTMISIEIEDLLVHCDTPDESLQLSCTTNAANSSLTPV